MNRFLLSLCLLLTTSALAQTTEPLSRRIAFGGHRFYLGETRISRTKLREMFRLENPEAYAELRKAGDSRALSAVFGIPGGGLVGYEVGNWATGGQLNAVRSGIGAALFLTSIFFDFKSESHLERAIALHNQRAGKIRLAPGLTSDGGFGLRLQF